MRVGLKDWIRRALSARRRERAEAFAQILLVAFIVLFVRLSSSPPLAPIVLCPFRQLTGLPCPGCGMTRALNALAHGQWARALSLHPLSPIVATGILAVGISAFARSLLPPQAQRSRWSMRSERAIATPWILRLMLALALGTWVFRLIHLFTSGEAPALLRQGWLSRALSP
ncbi:hypothetical protein HRbin10_01612 [bacterium HR10]|nr:hypothetical protein HRbin10_01612 [bacterium HR10]